MNLFQEMNVSEQVDQASEFARKCLKAAIKVIDGEMGKDSSRHYPGLVSHVMATIERDMTAGIYARSVHLDRLEDELSEMREIVNDVMFLRDSQDEYLIAMAHAFNWVYKKERRDASRRELQRNAEQLCRVFGR